MILLWPSGRTREILLAGTPAVGHRIRLRAHNGRDTPPLVVEQVLWVEAATQGAEPTCIVSVREQPA